MGWDEMKCNGQGGAVEGLRSAGARASGEQGGAPDGQKRCTTTVCTVTATTHAGCDRQTAVVRDSRCLGAGRRAKSAGRLSG